MFFNGIQREFNRAVLDQHPRKDQDELLQQIYDGGYNVKEIAKLMNITPQSLYTRINAHRGRGGNSVPT